MKILVTRPDADQKQTIGLLSGLGIEAVSSPVMEAIKLPFMLPDRASELPWQAMVVTSRNALRMLESEQLAQLRSVALYCVGAQTETLARSLGFDTIGETSPDVAHLTDRLLDLFSPDAGPILYLTAKHRSGKLAQALDVDGFDYTLIESYEMVALSSLTEEAVAAIQTKRLDGVLLYSSRTSQLLLTLFEKHDLADDMQHVTFYCLSDAVASPLKPTGYPLVVSAAPNEQSLLACVKKDHN
ncbi:uroporphyrinogen-III synthase [Cohaesibacter celericrescens]|uniref:uroporphyrinogen-III synthase n=1 Tax=Cohaesibacter celericrescens TaxID=2067669 RepID=UPI0015E08A04|nr:uroporphyrinogen-III synthase [Cohaesibacter celericrescens]